MKLNLTPRALLLATSLCLARADILVQDGFLDETTVTDMMQQLPATGASRFRDVVDLPSTLYGRLLSVLQPGAEGRNLQAPVRGEQGSVAAHKDHFADGSVAAAQVGLVYLEGDGRMTFTHDATGKETVVDVKPGRFLSWNNAEYTHVLEAGLAPRRMLGPMAFKDGMLQSIGDPFDYVAQAYVSPLEVRPGGAFTVTLDLLIKEIYRHDRKLIPSFEEFVISCREGDNFQESSANRTKGKFADGEDLIFKSSTLTPNHFKPKLRYEEDGDELVWVLPTEDLQLDKTYKMKWKGRVGRNMQSGDELTVTVSVQNAFTKTLTVVVK